MEPLWDYTVNGDSPNNLCGLMWTPSLLISSGSWRNQCFDYFVSWNKVQVEVYSQFWGRRWTFVSKFNHCGMSYSVVTSFYHLLDVSCRQLFSYLPLFSLSLSLKVSQNKKLQKALLKTQKAQNSDSYWQLQSTDKQPYIFNKCHLTENFAIEMNIHY